MPDVYQQSPRESIPVPRRQVGLGLRRERLTGRCGWQDRRCRQGRRGQGIKGGSGVPPIRYDALLECLKQLGFQAHQSQASIHMPRAACDLAGGKWDNRSS